MRRKPPLSVKEALETLEHLREATSAADPHQPAPPFWIAEMHRALRAIAPQEEVQRRRMDGLLGINMAYLHKRVQAILDDFNQIVAENPRLSVRDEAAGQPVQGTYVSLSQRSEARSTPRRNAASS